MILYFIVLGAIALGLIGNMGYDDGVFHVQAVCPAELCYSLLVPTQLEGAC